MNVELIYEQTCPNIELARTRLRQAFRRTGFPATWREWEVSQPDIPPYALHYGSPTILVDGQDVSGDGDQANGNSCRVYATDNGFEPVPAVEHIASRLRGAAKSSASTTAGLSAIPSVGVALLPNLTCPACWPAYSALLSSAGIGFIDYTPYLLPTMAVFLSITLAALAYRAPARRGYGPFWLGIFASLGIVTGKFIIDDERVLYVGVGLLIGASLWNILPHTLHRPPVATSTSCAQTKV